jgi:hypothetical protein
MKRHPESVLLIEKMPGGLWWQVAERETNETGFSNRYHSRATHLHALRPARDKLREIKGKPMEPR